MKRSSRGFTVMEVAMVLVIIAVTAMVVGPNFTSILDAWDLENETRKLAIKARELQQMAIFNQDNYGIRMDRYATSYDWGTYDPTTNVFTVIETVNLESGLQMWDMLSSVAIPGFSQQTMYFDSFGVPNLVNTSLVEQPGYCNILINDTRSGDTYQVDIENLTGWVRARN